jgi:hypothetical protein
VRRQSRAASLSASVPLLSSSTNLCTTRKSKSCLLLPLREREREFWYLLVEVEEESVIEKRGRGVSTEEREGGVDVTSLKRATGPADEDARAVRIGGWG